MIKKNPDKSSFAFLMFCLWTFVLLYRPQDLFPFLVPLRPALVTSALTLAAVLVCFKYLPERPLLHNSQIKFYLALYAVMIFGIPFSLYARRSFEIVVTEYILTVIFVCIFFKLIHSVQRLRKVLLISCLGSGLYFVYALRDFAPGSGRLAYGTMFDPNDLAFFALGFLPLNLLFLSRNNPLLVRLICLVTFSSGLLLILFTGSRGGVIGLSVSAILLLFFTSTTLNRTIKTGLVIACVLTISIVSIDMERFTTIFSIEQDYNIQSETGRIAIWGSGVRMFLQHPLTGVGAGSFPEAVGIDRQQRGLESARWQSPHSSIVQIGTETGVIGLILYLILSFNVIRIFVRALKMGNSEMLIKVGEVGLVGFSGMFIAGMFLSHAYSIYWAFYVAIAAVVSQQLEQSMNILKVK